MSGRVCVGGGRAAELTGNRSRHRLRHQRGTNGLHEEYTFYTLLFWMILSEYSRMNQATSSRTTPETPTPRRPPTKRRAPVNMES